MDRQVEFMRATSLVLSYLCKDVFNGGTAITVGDASFNIKENEAEWVFEIDGADKDLIECAKYYIYNSYRFWKMTAICAKVVTREVAVCGGDDKIITVLFCKIKFNPVVKKTDKSIYEATYNSYRRAVNRLKKKGILV